MKSVMFALFSVVVSVLSLCCSVQYMIVYDQNGRPKAKVYPNGTYFTESAPTIAHLPTVRLLAIQQPFIGHGVLPLLNPNQPHLVLFHCDPTRDLFGEGWMMELQRLAGLPSKYCHAEVIYEETALSCRYRTGGSGSMNAINVEGDISSFFGCSSVVVQNIEGFYEGYTVDVYPLSWTTEQVEDAFDVFVDDFNEKNYSFYGRNAADVITAMFEEVGGGEVPKIKVSSLNKPEIRNFIFGNWDAGNYVHKPRNPQDLIYFPLEGGRETYVFPDDLANIPGLGQPQTVILGSRQ